MKSGPKPRTAIQRAWPKIQLAGPDECWLWTGSTNNMRRPYGHLNAGGRGSGSIYVHRLIYETFVGPIPEGWQIDHLCNTSLCCNPSHMQAVTQQENLARRGPLPNALKTHCIREHPFDEENTYITSDGRRACRECKRVSRRMRALQAG